MQAGKRFKWILEFLNFRYMDHIFLTFLMGTLGVASVRSGVFDTPSHICIFIVYIILPLLLAFRIGARHERDKDLKPGEAVVFKGKIRVRSLVCKECGKVTELCVDGVMEDFVKHGCEHSLIAYAGFLAHGEQGEAKP